MYKDKQVLKTRVLGRGSYRGEYKFVVVDLPIRDGLYVVCHTPENSFGYPDSVLVDFNAWTAGESGLVKDRVYKPRAYTLYRHLPNYILKEICEIIVKLTDQIKEEVKE